MDNGNNSKHNNDMNYYPYINLSTSTYTGLNYNTVKNNSIKKGYQRNKANTNKSKSYKSALKSESNENDFRDCDSYSNLIEDLNDFLRPFLKNGILNTRAINNDKYISYKKPTRSDEEISLFWNASFRNTVKNKELLKNYIIIELNQNSEAFSFDNVLKKYCEKEHIDINTDKITRFNIYCEIVLIIIQEIGMKKFTQREKLVKIPLKQKFKRNYEEWNNIQEAIIRAALFHYNIDLCSKQIDYLRIHSLYNAFAKKCCDVPERPYISIIRKTARLLRKTKDSFRTDCSNSI